MRIAVGSDEQTHLTDAIVRLLKERGHDLTLHGALVDEGGTSWPEAARAVSEELAEGRANEGILLCWTGTGVSIAANKVPGVRAALCDDAETARGARLWNNANVLCLSLRRTSEVIAKEIIESWFNTTYESNPEDEACLKALDNLEHKYSRKSDT